MNNQIHLLLFGEICFVSPSLWWKTSSLYELKSKIKLFPDQIDSSGGTAIPGQIVAKFVQAEKLLPSVKNQINFAECQKESDW